MTTTATQGLNRQTPLPLDPPTEFQQMIANSMGKTLPIYGANLFPQSTIDIRAAQYGSCNA